MATTLGAAASKERAAFDTAFNYQTLVAENDLPDYTVLGRPIPGTAQELAVSSPCDVTLFCGTRGGGKSWSMLMNFARELDKGYGSFYKGVILGYEFQSLTNIVSMSKELFQRLSGSFFYSSLQTYEWRFRGGEILRFRHCTNKSDYENKIHGSSYAWLGVEESTNWETPQIINMVATTLRTGFKPSEHSPDLQNPLPDLQTRIFLVCNPSGVGRLWHKDKYIDTARYGSIVWKDQELRSPDMKEVELSKRSQVAIFSSFIENSYFSANARASLHEACAGDPVLYGAWIEGRWDVSSGGALDDQWDSRVHVLEPFVVPDEWYINRSHDWGSIYPSATIWWAESNGCEVEIAGKIRCFPRGTIVAIAELYTCPQPGYNAGTKNTPAEVCEMILSTERALIERGIINRKPRPGPADDSIGSVVVKGTPSVKELMLDCGVHWTRSDRSPGARLNGLQLLRERLRASKRGEGLGLYFTRDCINCLKLVPTVPRDPKHIEDADQRSEDHLYDATRYRVLAAKHVSKPVRFTV